MPKVMVFNIIPPEEESLSRAEDLFNTVLDVVKEHGVCFLRFTKADGMVIIEPKHNAKINGVISDA